ncbi:MAG TPA: hypothetical protein VH025_07225 [Solirubrobacteraceae bacterium]|nr:hypothetical protein [Solirubrobacteraceae bacterium]
MPAPVAEQLEALAAAADQPPTTLAGQFVRAEVARAAADGQVRPFHESLPRIRAGIAGGGRACWLEPYGGDADWRAEMWGQIVALHGRYLKALSWLQEGWWTDAELLEPLCALATWRAEIDDTGVDAREELSFTYQLREFSQDLRKAGGGGSHEGMEARRVAR